MTDDELVQVIKSHDDEAVTAGEVAEIIEMTNAGALERLNDLAQDGVVTKKKVGSRAVVWWVNRS